MSVSDQSPVIQYSTDGSTKTFSFPAYFCAQADLVVEFEDSGGTVTTKTLNSDYTISGSLDSKLNVYSGGASVIFGTAPATGGTLTITRKTPPTQPSVWAPEDPFPAGTNELAHDRHTLILQEILAGFSR